MTKKQRRFTKKPLAKLENQNSAKTPRKSINTNHKTTNVKVSNLIKRFAAHIPKKFQQFVPIAITPKAKRILVAMTTIVAILFWLFWDVPFPTKLNNPDIPVSTKIFDREGNLIYEIYANKRSTPIDIKTLPKYVIDATIAIEDKDFYKHHGISFSGIARATYNTLFKRKLQGGSTLTQQLVKNTLLTPERTIKRKIREFVLTIIVESIYSKDQILQMYLNQIPYGSTAYGIGAASEVYFGKEPKDLTLAESALLAGLLAAPSYYSPFGAYPELAKTRQEAVLRRMVEDNYISQEEADKALNEKINFAKSQPPKAPHFALWIKSILAQKYGEAVVEKGGLRVTTTLDLDLQEFAQEVVSEEVSKLKKQKVGNGAAIVIYPPTGEILAMVGSKDYFAEDEDGKVNIIFSQRQPGSAIKPLNYALAIRDKKITLSTPFADVPTCFLTKGQKPYCPVNYDGLFHGAIQARFALGNSYNIPAVRILALNGIENFVNFAREMGITTFKDPSNYGLSLTLGGGEVRPIDMAQAFSVFANQGIKQDIIAITKVEDWKGKVYEKINPSDIELNGPRVLDPSVTFLISHTLYDNNARSAAFGETSFLNVKNHPEVSVKTGTTNDRRDNWTVGYTPIALVLTWVGNNDNTPMTGAVSGISGASPIWNKIMYKTLEKAEKGYYKKGVNGHIWPNKPHNIIGTLICANTGNVPANPESPDCPVRFEYFLEDSVGANVQYGNKDIPIDKNSKSIASPTTPPDQIEIQNHPFLLDPLGTLICLDCPMPQTPVTIGYP